jgi:hypothetical protein
MIVCIIDKFYKWGCSVYVIVDDKLDETNLKIIDASMVPDRRVEKGKWELIFEKIPTGKALVIEENEASESAVRTGLYELQDKGKFKNFIVRKVRSENGSYTLYVINDVQPAKIKTF